MTGEYQNSAVLISPRWPKNSTAEEVANASIIHARLTPADHYTLCEKGTPGAYAIQDSVALVLSAPGAEELRDRVTCVDCREWMHA